MLPEVKQNLVVLMESTKNTHDNSSKAGYMCFNRFCIDEDAAFELSGVVFWTNPLNDEVDAEQTGMGISLTIHDIEVI